jgi:hypothetical protein
LIATVTPGVGAPDASVTVPETVAPTTCPRSEVGQKILQQPKMTRNTTHFCRTLLELRAVGIGIPWSELNGLRKGAGLFKMAWKGTANPLVSEHWYGPGPDLQS